MASEQSTTQSTSSVWLGHHHRQGALLALIAIIVILGIFFRVANLDRKVYWHDETYTNMAIAAYTTADVEADLFDGRIITPDAVQTYQQLNPNKTMADVAHRLAIEEPQHPPLYSLLARRWAHIFGTSVTSLRSLSAIFGILLLPAMYWLCLELFQLPAMGWMAICLVAVSPFHVLYAQEARSYSLWAMVVALSSAALLRAMRLNHRRAWGLYALTLSLSFYTILLSVLMAVGHGLYVLVHERCRYSLRVGHYLVAALVAIITFSPWIWVLQRNASSTESVSGWTSQPLQLVDLVKAWAANISRLFFDINLDADDPLIYSAPIIVLLLLLLVYAVQAIWRHAPWQVWTFLLLLGAIPALALIMPDLLLGGRRSAISRYLIPTYLCLQLALAYQLCRQMVAVRLWQQRLWQIITSLIILAGVISCTVSLQADTWWIKKNSHHHPQTARIINQAERPLLVSSNFNVNLGELMSLSYLLDAHVRLQLVQEPAVPQMPTGFSDVFIFNVSPDLKRQIERQQGRQIEPVYESGRLSRLARPEP